jgi:hypothetical protein
MGNEMTDVSNSADIIDSRDVIARIEELEDIPIPDRTGDEQDELDSLVEFAEDGETNLSEWNHGVVLIRDSYFEDYAREFAADIGAINGAAGWPLSYIDWEAAAEALQVDYFNIEFDGVTYWGRG